MLSRPTEKHTYGLAELLQLHSFCEHLAWLHKNRDSIRAQMAETNNPNKLLRLLGALDVLDEEIDAIENASERLTTTLACKKETDQ